MAISFIQKIETTKGVSYKAHFTDPLSGKRRCKSFPRRKDAQAFLESPKATGEKVQINCTVSQAVDHWIHVCKSVGRNGREPVARSTLKPYERHARYFKKAVIEDDGVEIRIGDVLLEKLTKSHCEAVRQKLIEEFTWPNAHKFFTSFKSVLTQARADELMESDPAEFVFLKQSKRTPDALALEDDKVFQLDEIRTLLKTMKLRVRISNKQLRRRRLRYNLIFKTIAFAGTRPGEALGLSWENVDFERGGIRIAQDVDDDGSIGLLKTRAAYRFINMPDHYMRQLHWWRFLAPHSKDGLVFPNWSGKVEFLSNLNKRGWQPLMIEAGIVNADGNHKYPPKSLRHARASLEIHSGANAKEIQRLMGHSSIRVTYDVYGHLFEEHDDRRQDRANRIASQLMAAE